ncbi:MAG: hypothetical protein JW862_03500 [Anaerolineales bacterium]|nr:hypothetical protein [Anaerolineales bacterium]
MTNASNWLSSLFRPWVILAACLLAIVLLVVTLLLVNGTRPAPEPVGMVTAAVTVIPAPTQTPTPPIPTQALPTPAEDVPPGPPEGTFQIGAFVSVSGTGGDGLRLRAGPGLDAEPRYLGLEGEIFLLQDGPRQVDGYTWWLLVTPTDTSRQGWAVANYLALAQNP